MSVLAVQQVVEPLTQFGVAGLMGLLWVWERTLTRRRETQLDEAHRRLERKSGELRLLVRTIHRNTRVIERFEQTQQIMHQLLERISHAQEQAAPPDPHAHERADDGRTDDRQRLRVAPGNGAAAARGGDGNGQ